MKPFGPWYRTPGVILLAGAITTYPLSLERMELGEMWVMPIILLFSTFPSKVMLLVKRTAAPLQGIFNPAGIALFNLRTSPSPHRSARLFCETKTNSLLFSIMMIAMESGWWEKMDKKRGKKSRKKIKVRHNDERLFFYNVVNTFGAGCSTKDSLN